MWQNEHDGWGEALLSTVVTTNYSYTRQVPQQTSTVILLTMPVMTGEKDEKWQLSSKVMEESNLNKGVKIPSNVVSVKHSPHFKHHCDLLRNSNIKNLAPCGTDGRLLLSGFQLLLTLTLTLDRVIRHTVVHHSSTCMYIANFIEIGKTFSRRTNRRDPPSSR